MRSVIQQTVLLPAPAEDLFAMYLDAALHEAITGAPVTISDQPGSPFAAFGGQLRGTTLCVVAPKLIVQSWRSENFFDEDADSTLILGFSRQGDQGRIDLIHLDVPEQDFQGVTDGWEHYYWAPWREFLARR
jgi:activator of HSP90 ATPase